MLCNISSQVSIIFPIYFGALFDSRWNSIGGKVDATFLNCLFSLGKSIEIQSELVIVEAQIIKANLINHGKILRESFVFFGRMKIFLFFLIARTRRLGAITRIERCNYLV